MKKTIIAMMALAGVAMAAPVENASQLEWSTLSITTPANGTLESGNSVINWSEDTGNLTESWELSFTLDPSRLSKQYIFGTVKGNSGAEGYTLSIESDGKIALNQNKDTNILMVGSYTANDSAVAITLQFVQYVDSEGSAVGGMFTLTVGNDTASYTVDSDDNTTFTKGSNNNVWTNGGAEKLSGISLKSAGSVIAPVQVPEPTTATLSLLALAGLAARRRRR